MFFETATINQHMEDFIWQSAVIHPTKRNVSLTRKVQEQWEDDTQTDPFFSWGLARAEGTGMYM